MGFNKSLLNLAKDGFNVCAVITDDHPSNVNAFTWLDEMFDGDNKTFIKHPAYADLARKTYQFFDVIYLSKNIRSNLVNKKIVFLLFQFDFFRDLIHVLDDHISWRISHKVHERDENLLARLIKALKITYASW